MSDLDRLFYWRGIAPEFHNFRGELTSVPVENRIKILEAMGVDCSSSETIAAEAYDLDIKPWLKWLPELEVVPAGDAFVDINFQPQELGEQIFWRLLDDGNAVASSAFTPSDLPEVGDYNHEGKRYSKRRLALGLLEPKYYGIELALGERFEKTELAVAPTRAYQADWASDDRENPNGFVIQLYTLRSEANWGIGDFGDLYSLILQAAKRGVDIIGLNPFHALQPDLIENSSPYSPSDRRFLNALYIAVEQVPGYRGVFTDKKKIQALKDMPEVCYDEMRALKYGVLFDSFQAYIASGAHEFLEYLRNSDENLVAFANYEASHYCFDNKVTSRYITRKDLLSATEKCDDTFFQEIQLVSFYCYLQWVAEIQLSRCQRFAKESGMKVGIVRDLAVGACGSGAEVETNDGLFCHAAAIGAPPDPLALTGQNWGIPPMDPAALRKTGFKHFRTLLNTNMKHCGALRIDHAMSLYRLWWCPPGANADKGAYIYYPFKELLGLLCLESHLAKCLIIAEDLGIVPDEFRAAMTNTGLYSNRVFYFEKWQDTEFKHPFQYERHALAMLDNHDVPTITSWWNGSDLALRHRLNLLEENSHIEHLLQQRRKEKQHLFSMMEHDGMSPEGWSLSQIDEPADKRMVFALIRFVCRARSQFFFLQLEDLLLMEDPVNVPGTFKEHKNWVRKLTHSLEDIFADESINTLLSSISELRNS